MPSPEQLQLIELLLARLERVSVDSYWAHRASGVRGALLRALEKTEAGREIDESGLNQLTQSGFCILSQAARDKS